MKQVFGDYYLGLDIGTDSVGWAVTNENYEILDFNRKAMWGIHLFDSGKTAEERRLHRGSRRRLARRKQRIDLLQELFASEISKVDPSFFERLNESRYMIEDRNHKQHNTLFNDPNFEDRDLHKKYPTIFHLRHDLTKTNTSPDIRLVYLAVHHIIKYRGHFLFDGVSGGDIPEFESLFKELLSIFNNECGTSFSMDNVLGDIKNILLDRNAGITNRKNKLIDLISADGVIEKSFCNILAGGTVKLALLFEDESLESEKITLNGSEFEERTNELEDMLGSDRMNILNYMKQIFDWSILTDLLKECDSISEMMIKQYNQHRIDLKILKNLIKENLPEQYNDVFKSSNVPNNYCAYVGIYKKGVEQVKSCTQEEFCTYLKNLFKGASFDSKIYMAIKDRIENNTFMPKQTSKNNALIPNILHRKELTAILDNISKHHPFLNSKDDRGISVKEKIVLLCTFRIPYYVGPLNNNSERSWAVRKEGGMVTPWSFKDKIDLDLSAEAFIENLTNMCTYLIGEKVIPKESLMYSRFRLCNELNTLSINGERIEPKLKNEIISDLFLNVDTIKKVTMRGLEQYLKQRGLFKEGDVLEGADSEIKSNLKSEVQVRKILGDRIKDKDMVEGIIRCITIFKDDRFRLKKKLNDDYSDKLNKDEISELSKLKFSDWGRLSEKFLSGIYHTDRSTGESYNILSMLERTNMNLMELLKDEYSFKGQIEQINSLVTNLFDGNMSYEMLDDEPVSPTVRRSIWRTLCIIQEITKITGHGPKKIFLETTREDREKKRTTSRKQQLIERFKACKEQEIDWIGAIEGMDEGRLRGKKLYSYLSQHGKCMYCGKRIDLNDLGDRELCDMDHIYPKSKKFDDSIQNNLVLVCKPCNQTKSNAYPLPEEWQQRMSTYWKHLKDGNFITTEKYKRLIRVKPFSDEELGDFISRQLVETSQSVKAVANILKRIYKDDSDIIYVKGRIVSDFRNEYGFVKCRVVNDYHHAKDAYLNIVVGNIHDVKFTKNPLYVVRNKEGYNLGKMYEKNIERNGRVAWISGNKGTIATVSKYMQRNNILFTRFQYEGHGQLFDQNKVKANPGKFPAKRGEDSSRYGGYDNVSGSYFVLVEQCIKNKKKHTIEAIPIHIAITNPSDEIILDHLTSMGLESPKLILNKILMKSTFEINGFRLHISARTGNNIVYTCGEQLILPYDVYAYCKRISKYREICVKERRDPPISDYNLTIEENISMYDILALKLDESRYGTFLQAYKKHILTFRNDFISSRPELQIKVLNEMLHAFQCNSAYVNLKDLKGPGTVGRIILNKNISDFQTIFLIHQSPSGLFERKINLKEI